MEQKPCALMVLTIGWILGHVAHSQVGTQVVTQLGTADCHSRMIDKR